MKTPGLFTLLTLLLSPVWMPPLSAEESETKFDLYGYFKFDMARDSNPSTHGNYVLYVLPRARGTAVPSIHLTARQSRLGVKIRRGEHLDGRLEIDFYGDSPENKNALLLRHAYARIPLGSFVLEAGQTSDMISPLVPSTLNYSVTWGAGNIGYRRPQVKFYRRGERYWAGVAVGRNIAGDLDGDSINDGTTGWPVLQCRLAFKPLVNAEVGASGHYGRCSCSGSGDHYANWSLGADLKLALEPRLSLLGEVYTGANLKSYGGAIYNGDSSGGLHSRGGWANIQYHPTALLSFSIGGGLDAVEKGDLVGRTDARQRNRTLFANGIWKLAPDVRFGLEISQWRTRYVNPGPKRAANPADWRLQSSIQSNF